MDNGTGRLDCMAEKIIKIEKVKNNSVTEYLHYLECAHVETRLKKLVSSKMVCTQCKNAALVQPTIVEEPVVEEYEDVSTDSTIFSFTHSPPEPLFVEPVRVVEEVVEPPKNIDFVVASGSTTVAREIVMQDSPQVDHQIVNQLENVLINQIALNIANAFKISDKQVDLVLSDNSDGFVIKFAKVFLTGDDISKITSRNVDFS